MLGNDWEIKQRLKIQSANTVNLLIQHFHGKIVLEPGQIHVGLSLLKKVLPDVSFVEIKGSVTHSVIRAPTLASDAETWTIEHVPPEHKLIETEPE
jgi:hypothetical protein